MTEPTTVAAGDDPQTDAVEGLLEAAGRLGIEMDHEEAGRWLAAMQAEAATGTDIVVDVSTGVYGHRVSMLDFEPRDLDRFREIGRLVGFEDRPPTVTTALALSGSAAQSKIQQYPGDADFFERVHIQAPTREEACRILAETMREKAIATRAGSSFRLIEVKFGSYPEDLVRNGQPYKAGGPIGWTADEVAQASFVAQRPDGTEVRVAWDDVAAEPGWCKLDWIVADPKRRRVANASNMLDVTWEAPDGAITPLDGFLDPYFQEVYLEAESAPLFTKLAKELSGDALDRYIDELESEVRKYLDPAHANYGKAARRMYNVFRLTGRYTEAAYVRELFDEPATVLYQVWSLSRSIEEAFSPDHEFDMDTLQSQTDELIMSAVRVLEGPAETEVLGHLLKLRDTLLLGGDATARAEGVEGARRAAMLAVNDYFLAKLTAVPAIAEYMDRLVRGESEAHP